MRTRRRTGSTAAKQVRSTSTSPPPQPPHPPPPLPPPPGGDRTFHSENDSGIGGAGDVKFSDKHGRGESLKDGCYDAGDGYYDVRDGLVHIYPDAPSGEEQKEAKDEAEKEQVPDRTREPTEEEKKWVLAKGHTTLNTAMGKPLEDEGELGF